MKAGKHISLIQETILSVLIAIPVYNEIKYISRVLQKVRSFHDQILFIDDYSTDGTTDFLLNQSGIHLIRHHRNMGYGKSIIDAFQFAYTHRYDWVITMDCDEQHEPETLPLFFTEIAADQWDIVSGSRYTDQNKLDDLAPNDRRLINHTITTLINDLFGWHLTDTFCGFKAHRVSAMQKLNLDESGYAFPLQLWPKAYHAGLRIKEIPVRRIYNDPNRSFGGNLDDADRRLRHYLNVLKRELIRIHHPCAEDVDDVSIQNPHACYCGCP